MSEATREKKRRRETGSDDDENIPRQSPEVWFDDGNLVLVAEGVAFKVYRGILARQSSIFKDMFEVSEAQAGEMLYDCPVVRLHDTASELCYFLDVLCNGFQLRRCTDWYLLRAVLLLSHKYDAETSYGEALYCLQQVFPDELDAWSVRPETVEGEPVLYDPSKNCISAANVARQLELSWIHAAALYDCCQLSSKVLVTGTEDGEVLTPEDLVRCIDAMPLLIAAGTPVRDTVLAKYTAPVRCKIPTCRIRIFAIYREWDFGRPRGAAPACALLQGQTWWDHLFDDVCQDCTEATMGTLRKARKDCLERLPWIFDLI